VIGRRAAALAVALAGVAPTTASALPVRGPFGAGRNQTWIVPARGPARDVVVFGHGWKTAPSAGISWVRQFGPWLEHLRAAGSDVVFPRYQAGGETSPSPALVEAFRHGAEAGLARLSVDRLPTVMVGYSFGASLAFSYAANAHRWGLPRPAAVMAVFPAGPVTGSPLPPLHGPVRVLVQVGDRDDVAGSGGAQTFWRWLRTLPAVQRRYEVVHSREGLVATHAAPKLSSHPAQRAFWRPLDDLIAVARREVPGGRP